MEKAWLFVALVVMLIITTGSAQGPPFGTERWGKRSSPKVIFQWSIRVIFFLRSVLLFLGQRLKKTALN